MSRLSVRFLVVTLFLALPLAAFAANIAPMSAAGTQLTWSPAASSYASVDLVVSAPDGQIYTKRFTSQQTPSFSLGEIGSDLADGVYKYELRVNPRVSTQVAVRLKAAREAGDDATAKKILAEAGVAGMVQSGSFAVLGGTLVTPDVTEATEVGNRRITTNARPTTPVTNTVIPDDLIVQGSICAGFDCVNGESFGFDTIRMKENNTRIDFTDTSTSAGFPSQDWEIAANDSASGGRNALIVSDENTQLFVVESGNSANAIYVDDTGRVGFRTSTPVLDLHVNTSNTPAIRLEQNSSGGFTAQTWDIGANEANFFVRDVTGGSKLSLRIRPGAPTSSVDISADGDVGIGTGSPDEKLHVSPGSTGEDANTISLVDNLNATGLSAAAVVQAKADTAITSLIAHGSGRTLSRFGQTLGGFSEVLNAAGDGLIVGTLGATPLILGTNSTARMTIASTGAITVPGNFTVSGVKNFATVDPADTNNALYYTALEGPEAGTYFRGSAQTVNGEVVIELPGYFARLTESERMTVQLTPIGAPGQLYVAEKTPSKLVVKVAEGSADLQFDYLVQGVRKGYLDYQVERTGAFPVKQ